MSSHSHHDASLKTTFCEQLGEDLGADICAEVEEHLRDCPDCRAQYNSVRQTVELYRKTCSDSNVIPPVVEERLFKVLHIKPHAS